MARILHPRLAVALSLSLSACGKGAPDASSTAKPAEQAATSEPVDCVPVGGPMLGILTSGLKGAGGNLLIAILNHAFSVRDPASSVFYVSALVTPTAGGEGVVMTWATTSLQPGAGLVLAVSAGAQAISDFPSQTDKVHTDAMSAPAKASRQCVTTSTGVVRSA